MAKSKKKAPAKKPAAKKAARPARLAVKLLANLPALSETRRRAYRVAFTEAQCAEWGAKTKATAVLADAERAVGAFQASVRRGVDGYSVNRLAWLCGLMVELEDAISRQEAGSSGTHAGRAAITAIADRTRLKLAHGLQAVAGGYQQLAQQIAERNEWSATPAVLQASITGLLQLAMRARRSPEGEVLCDDAGLTETFLSGASAVADSLTATIEADYQRDRSGDSRETNIVEGRVLRELDFARACFERAKARGDAAPAFPALGTLKGFKVEPAAAVHGAAAAA